MPPAGTPKKPAAPRKPKGPPKPAHVRGGTSVQRRGGGYYLAGGGTRTIATPGGRKVSVSGRQARYQAVSGQRVALTAPSPPSRTYHRIILAEFVTCVVLVSAVPVLAPRKPGAADEALSLSAPLVRLTAVCIVFFVLALMGSGDKAGKAAAAFGGLITLGALLNATDTVTGLAMAFAGTPRAPADAEAGEPLPAGG